HLKPQQLPCAVAVAVAVAVAIAVAVAVAVTRGHVAPRALTPHTLPRLSPLTIAAATRCATRSGSGTRPCLLHPSTSRPAPAAPQAIRAVALSPSPRTRPRTMPSRRGPANTAPTIGTSPRCDGANGASSTPITCEMRFMHASVVGRAGRDPRPERVLDEVRVL